MTKDDFETLDNYTRWRRDKLDAEDNQLERRRMKTRGAPPPSPRGRLCNPDQRRRPR
jgi:hypothetical protein